MAIGTTILVTAIVTAVMAGAATTYYKTDGWGAGNKVKSGLDIKKEQEAKKAAETVNQIQRGGRYFSKVRNNYATQPTRPTQPTQTTQYTQPLQPTIGTLPTLPTGYRWQEIQNQTQAQKDSELFVDRYDSNANRGIFSSSLNILKDPISKLETPKTVLDAVSLPLKFLYDLGYSTVDNLIWDLDGDKDSMIKNIFVDPWIEVSEGNSDWGQALLGNALNTLNSVTEVFDILANPIKGIANQGFQGFLNGLGIGGQGYVVYDLDTGNFGTDLLAEILSDPLNFAMLAKAPLGIAKGITSVSAKATAKKVTTEGLEAVSKEGLQSVLKKSSKEMLANTAARLATSSAKLSKEAGVELTESASKQINRFLANQLVKNGFTDVNEEVLEGLYKQALKTLTTKLGANKINAYALRQLDLNSILPDLTKALKKVAKETKDLSLKKAYKAIAKYGIIDSSPKISSTAYLQRFQDIVTDSAENVLIDANKRLALGMSQDLGKVQDEILARASRTLAKANIPVTPANLELLKKAVSEFVRDLDLNSMTARVLTSMNPVGQKLYMKLDKSIKWLSKIDDDLNVFQKGLGKVALYGTAAPLPILGKALKNTPYGKLVSNRSGEWLKALFAKITNRAAVKFNKAVAEMAQEFTPESYTAMRKIFMDNTAVASEKLALDLSEGLINPEDFKGLTYTEAFQRSFISKFSQDLAYFDKVLKENKDDIAYISQHWEDYIRENYKMSSKQYLYYLEKINTIESSLTGSAVYSPFINRIKTNEAILNVYTLNQQIRSKPLITLKQGRTLSVNELKKLNPNIYSVTREEYNRIKYTIADRQAFIQTDNKAYTQQKLFEKVKKIEKNLEFIEQYFEKEYGVSHAAQLQLGEHYFSTRYSKETKKFTKVLKKLSKEDNNVVRAIEYLQKTIERTHRNEDMFKLLSSPSLIGVVGPGYEQEIYTVLVDTFMGLNNKIPGLDSLDEITNIFASVAEQQLKSRKIIPDITTGVLVNDKDFILNLRSIIELYSKNLDNTEFFVKDTSTTLLKDLKNLKYTLNKHSDFKHMYRTYAFIEETYDEINLIINKSYDDVFIIPTESIRAGLDLHNTSSIHDALMQAAEGALPSTTRVIADGANIARFFSNVKSSAKFDVAVLDYIQQLSDYASNIYNRVYFKEMLAKYEDSIHNVWKSVLQHYRGLTEKINTNTFFKELVYILNSTESLPALEKYCLLKTLYHQKAELHNLPFKSFDLSSQKTINGVVESILNLPANLELKNAILNFSKFTNKPVTMNTGYHISTALDIEYGHNTLQSLIDLDGIDAVYAQLDTSLNSLTSSIKHVSNSDAMLVSHLKQTKLLKQFYEEHINPFKAKVQDMVDKLGLHANLFKAQSFLDPKDLDTLQKVYGFVKDIPYEDLERLERSIEDHNKRLINVPKFIKAASKRKYAYGVLVEVVPPEKSVIDTYIKFMTDPDVDLTQPQYIKFLSDYSSALNPNEIPNFVRKALQNDVNFLNFINLKIDWSTDVTARNISSPNLKLGAAYNLEKIIRDYRKNILHSALNYKSATERGRFVNQVFEACLKTDPEMTKAYYETLWYVKKKNASELYFRPNNVTFNYDNVHIKEEFIANLLGNLHNPEALQKQITKYASAIEDKAYKGYANLINRTIQITPQLQKKLEIAYNSLMQDTIKYSANQSELVSYLKVGKPFKINEPYIKAEEYIEAIQRANNNRTHYMIRKRLQQAPIDFAKDLARTGPFQFYSISTIRNLKSKYGPYRYFDTDFNIRPEVLTELESLGVHMVKYDELDTIMFYIDKDKVAFDNASYYNKSRIDFTPEQFNWEKEMAAAGNSFNDAMYAITGQTTSYSNGLRADENFFNTLFNGVKNTFESDFASWTGLNTLNKNIGGWELEDLTKGNYYNIYRFNEMIMGNNSYMRRFGIYQSSNPYVNMSNALQQVQMMSKTKTELLTTFFDNIFSTGKEGVWGQYSAEQLFKAYQDHPEMVLITLRGKANNIGYRIQEFIPYSVADIQKAQEIGARFVPRSWYNLMYNVLNNRIGSKGLLKWFSKYNYIYKFATLAFNLMTFMRNAFDTYGKNVIELGEEMPHWTSYAWQIQNDYQNVNNALRQLGKFSEKDIEEFFTSGMSKAYAKANNFTYEMYKDLKHYEAWGPSTSGLADLVNNAKLDPNNPRILRTNGALSDSTLAALEPTDDELMRMIARDTVPGYKGLWENATDMSGQYFDFMNNTVGLKAEKTNRLALYLKATAEGKTREQAFQWIRDVHFDYSTRTIFEQALELIFPFITFTMKNAEYWMRAIENTPWVQRYLADYLQTQMNYYDFDNNERAASEQWQYLIKSGNIPLWKTEDNIQAYFKLNPSFMDAFNTFINPIEVLKDRMLLPTRAIEKATTTDYKGQNLMGKQPVWNQVLDWASFIPGNALARRITNAVKQPDTFSALTNDAIGKIKMYKPYVPKQYSTKFVYNKDFTSRRLQTKVYNNNYSTYKQGQYQRVRSEIAKQKRLNRLGMGYSVTEPYNTTLRNVQGTTYFKMKLPTTQLPMPKADSNYLRLAKYRVQRGYFNR